MRVNWCCGLGLSSLWPAWPGAAAPITNQTKDNPFQPHSHSNQQPNSSLLLAFPATATKERVVELLKRESVCAGRLSSLWASCLGLRPANNPQRKQAIGQLSLSPQEQQLNSSLDCSLGAAYAATNEIQSIFPLGRED